VASSNSPLPFIEFISAATLQASFWAFLRVVNRSPTEGVCPHCGGIERAPVLIIDGTAIAPPKRWANPVAQPRLDITKQGNTFNHRIYIEPPQARVSLLRFANKVPVKHKDKPKKKKRRPPDIMEPTGSRPLRNENGTLSSLSLHLWLKW
jgi:hypothetical protein